MNEVRKRGYNEVCASIPTNTKTFAVVYAVLTTFLWTLCCADVTGNYNASGKTGTHVCIVGAGIAGAAAAFHIDRSARITVYEALNRTGGRITSVSLGYGVTAEAGASIIAAENKLMRLYVEQLNLRQAKRDSKNVRRMGVWDGFRFRLLTSGRDWIDAVLLLWKYGFSLLRMRTYVRDLLTAFNHLYTDADDGYKTVESLLKRSPGLYALTQRSFNETVSSLFSPALVGELISAITRVNYNQDVEQMNGLSGAVALAGSGSGLWSVEGGNAQVVSGLFERADATILLNSCVSSVKYVSATGKYAVVGGFSGDQEDDGDQCDAVILALPMELSGIDLSRVAAQCSTWDVQRKYKLTVTTFVRGWLRSSYFGISSNDARDLGIVLTAAHADSPFSSIGRISLVKVEGNPVAALYKIFSKARLEPAVLRVIFEDDVQVIKTFDWHAYPVFSPPERFASFQLCGEQHNIYYTAPIESASSAIEMSALSGRNIASLVNQGLGLTKSRHPVEMDNKDEL